MLKARFASFEPPFGVEGSRLCPSASPITVPRVLRVQRGCVPLWEQRGRTPSCKVRIQSSQVATVFKRQTDPLSDTANTKRQLGAWFWGWIQLRVPVWLDTSQLGAKFGGENQISHRPSWREVRMVCFWNLFEMCSSCFPSLYIRSWDSHGVAQKTKSQRKRSRKQVPWIIPRNSEYISSPQLFCKAARKWCDFMLAHENVKHNGFRTHRFLFRAAAKIIPLKTLQWLLPFVNVLLPSVGMWWVADLITICERRDHPMLFKTLLFFLFFFFWGGSEFSCPQYKIIKSQLCLWWWGRDRLSFQSFSSGIVLLKKVSI